MGPQQSHTLTVNEETNEGCQSHDEFDYKMSPNYFDSNDPAHFVGKQPLSDDAKLTLLTSKLNCPTDFVFPATAGRRFNLTWTVHRPWLRYSIANNSAYCLSCLCFAGVDTESPFTSTGFNKWKKALGKKKQLTRQTPGE